MPNWDFLNRHRIRSGTFHSDDVDGFNGAFQFRLNGENRTVCIVASDGEGWQHVSVSFGRVPGTPSWDVMCQVKDLFFEPEDWVVQFHPAKSAYVNNHKGCLHLWRCIDGREMPTPPTVLVGVLK